ncbi:glycoside hydrolase family 3 protein [Desulfocurvibacter africanus]|uniref:glycoside hydrolase family 3 protein n=1 Tax=Desulfocurvibacter africanus TaxID=873 RepID=UPI0003FF2A60|nr:glycoside hydrolase family 3 protein [Desulfocurvibacter africanus]
MRALLISIVLFVALACAAGALTSGSGTASCDIGRNELAAMAGQMILVGFRGLELDEDSPIAQDVRAGRVGGVILFDYDVLLKSPVRNVQSKEQLTRLTDALQRMAPLPLLVSVDQEGGKVSRLKERHGFAVSPSAAELGRGTPERTQIAAASLGRELAACGFNLDFAPVVDVNVNPGNPVIGRLGRSFSADPTAVADHAAAFVRGLHSAGVLSALKHFPGHGSSASDSHLGLTDVSATWSEKEIAPYRQLLAHGLVDVVMTGHLFNSALDPKHPGTLSRSTVQGLLRERLGFTGVVVSDDLQMRAVADHYGLRETIRLALTAGVDVLLFGNNLDYDPLIARKAQSIILELVDSGELPCQRILESHERVMALKAKLATRSQR